MKTGKIRGRSYQKNIHKSFQYFILSSFVFQFGSFPYAEGSACSCEHDVVFTPL